MQDQIRELVNVAWERRNGDLVIAPPHPVTVTTSRGRGHWWNHTVDGVEFGFDSAAGASRWSYGRVPPPEIAEILKAQRIAYRTQFPLPQTTTRANQPSISREMLDIAAAEAADEIRMMER